MTADSEKTTADSETRPDTRPSVAQGWAGAVMLKNRYRKKTGYGPTDGLTDGPRDTPSYRDARMHLKIKDYSYTTSFA